MPLSNTAVMTVTQRRYDHGDWLISLFVSGVEPSYGRGASHIVAATACCDDFGNLTLVTPWRG